MWSYFWANPKLKNSTIEDHIEIIAEIESAEERRFAEIYEF